MYVWLLAATGHEPDARRELAAQRAAVGTPSSWPRDTNWLSAAKELSEAAVLLGDLSSPPSSRLLLEPFADRMVVSARALFCMGSVSGALGRLADLRGDPKLAAERYARAIEREERAGALVWAMHHRFRLGQALSQPATTTGARSWPRRRRRAGPRARPARRRGRAEPPQADANQVRTLIETGGCSCCAGICLAGRPWEDSSFVRSSSSSGSAGSVPSDSWPK